MLIGTDYNIGGIKGVGPKNALKLIKRFGKDFEELFKEVKWDNYFDIGWNHVFYAIKNIPVTDDYELSWKKPDERKLIEILVERHDFSKERVLSNISGLKETLNQIKQKTLFDF
jgi:flap endonuclease-1